MRLLLALALVSCKLQPQGSALREEVALPKLNWQDCNQLPPLLAQVDLIFARIRGENKSPYRCKECHGGGDIFALSTVLHPASTAERISDRDGKLLPEMVRDFQESITRMPPILHGAPPAEQFGPGLNDKERKLLDDWIKAGAPVCRKWYIPPEQ
jgi:hypothetical protein